MEAKPIPLDSLVWLVETMEVPSSIWAMAVRGRGQNLDTSDWSFTKFLKKDNARTFIKSSHLASVASGNLLGLPLATFHFKETLKPPSDFILMNFLF